MEKEFVPYEIALAMKKLGFDEECFNRFYTKPNSKMFGVDEHGRAYSIKNTSKKLYTIGEHAALNEINVIYAPLYQQAFRWFFDNHRGCVSGMHDMTLHDLLSGRTDKDACLKKLIETVKEKL